MKIQTTLLVIFLSLIGYVHAQDTTTVEAKSESIAENLDLEAVASAFGEAESLEDFEKRLNDPDLKINNLDLNNDGKVDYLRVLDKSAGNVHVVTIQAVIGKDKFQDVATIEVVKEEDEKTKVQVVGDVAIYGNNYIIEPVYVQPPVVIRFFWTPHYHPWHSPYHWGYYPPYYRPWHPYPPHVYRRNVHVHVNVHNRYHRANVRYNSNAARIQSQQRRNDFKRTPRQSPAKTKPKTKVKVPTKNIPKTRPSTSMPKTRPSTSMPKTRPSTSMPKTRPSTSMPRTRPSNTIPRTRPTPSAPKRRPTGGFRRRR